MRDVLRLVRAHNLSIAAVGVLAGGWIALRAVALPASLCWAALSGIGLGAFGNALNDVVDLEADRANRRADRPLVQRRLGPYAVAACIIGGVTVGVAAAALAGWSVLGAAAAALVLMAIYSWSLKPQPVVGNLAVAVVAGLPLMYGALAVGAPADGTVPWALAAWLHLMREIVKDVSDEPGDRTVGRRTLPVVAGPRAAEVVAAGVGFLFIPASLLLPYAARYGAGYFLIALIAQMAVLVAATWLMLGRAERVSGLLKAAMVVGLAALVAGRVA